MLNDLASISFKACKITQEAQVWLNLTGTQLPAAENKPQAPPQSRADILLLTSQHRSHLNKWLQVKEKSAKKAEKHSPCGADSCLGYYWSCLNQPGSPVSLHQWHPPYSSDLSIPNAKSCMIHKGRKTSLLHYTNQATPIK